MSLCKTGLSLSIILQQDATMYILLYFCKLLYMFRVVTPPNIRSTYNCNYSIWHWSDFRKCGVWSQLKVRGMDPTVCPLSLTFSWIHTLHFPKFNQCQMLYLELYVLLMMGGVTTRNVYSSLQKYNKLYIVASVGWGTALQVGNSRVQFPMVSLKFFIDIILPAVLWPSGWLSL
jgi:hypothetical protein